MRANVSPNKYIETFKVMLIAYGDTLHFEIEYYNTDLFYYYFTDNLRENMELIKDTNYNYFSAPHKLTLTLPFDSLHQTITLPLVDSCNYRISGVDSSKFEVPPTIVGFA